MAKTTYLLGAGASAGSLPTVDKFVATLQDLIEKVNNVGVSYAKDNPKNKKILQNISHALQDLSLLYKGCVEHRSVDTFLKRLFLTIRTKEDENKYRIAKCSIILFFELYRFFYNNIDKRYDAFLATVLERENDKLILPPDINILSWNYDYEFERAYMKYSHQTNNIDEVYQDLNIIHKNSPEQRRISNNFGIIKINGTAGYFHNNKVILGLGYCNLIHKVEVIPDVKVVDNINDVLLLINNHHKFSRENPEEYQPAISFAWENGEGMEQIKKEIKTTLANTKNLITIGYSFPYFNRKTDKYTMDCLQKIANVKIYVQDKEDRVNDIIENIKELRKFSETKEVMIDYMQYEKMTFETQFFPKTDRTQFYMAFD